MVKLFTENEAKQFIDELAKLRIKIFREYPYLYDGDYEYEKKYLNKFLNTPDSMIAVAFEGSKVIGALTGLPLKSEDSTIKQPWQTTEFDIDEMYYFSEVLLLPENRGKGLGAELFKIAEEWVQSLNKYPISILATVVRDENHPKKSIGYKSLDSFWEKLGYRKTNTITCCIPWKEVGEAEETNKALMFWIKE